MELVVVLGVLSAMMCVVLPYANRSNDRLKITEDARDIAEVIRYAIELCQQQGRAVRLVVEIKQGNYYLEKADGDGRFDVMEVFWGRRRYFGSRIKFCADEGMEFGDGCCYVVFDPDRRWPVAAFRIFNADVVLRIRIEGRKVEIEETAV